MGRKITPWALKATNKQLLPRKNMDVAKKGHLEEETESLLIAAETTP